MPPEKQTFLIKQVAISFEEIGVNWPPEYQQFYVNWGYFNQVYATLYPKDQYRHHMPEWKQIALFALDYQILWPKVCHLAKPLASLPCVGISTSDVDPEERVRIATKTLREELKIDAAKICDAKLANKCSQRKIRCLQYSFPQSPDPINDKNPDHAKYTPLGAALTIIYQVRCNLFHGGKFEVSPPEWDRNIALVQKSNDFIHELLKQYFKSFNSNQTPD